MSNLFSYGEAFKERRLALGLTLGQVCEGICNVATLSRIESGQITPAYNRARALMERLALPDDEYWAMLSLQELKLEALRGEIVVLGERFFRANGAARRQIQEEAAAKLRELEQLGGRKAPIARQFAAAQRVLLTGPEGKQEWLARGEALTEILRMTLLRFQPEDMSGMLCSYFELELIAHIIIAFASGGEAGRVAGTVRQLDAYVSEHFSHRPPAIYILPFASIAAAMGQERWAEALDLAEAARRVPSWGRFLPEVSLLTEVMARCRRELGGEDAAGELYRQAEQLGLALTSGAQPGLVLVKGFVSSVGMRGGNLYAFGDYIKCRRQKKGLSQIEVCEGICATATYSRLETGRQTPSNYVAETILGHLDGVPYRFCFRHLSHSQEAFQWLARAYRGRFYAVSSVEERFLRETYGPILPEMAAVLKRCAVPVRRNWSSHVYILQIAMSGEAPERQVELLLEELRAGLPDFDLEDIGSCQYYYFAELEAIGKIAYLYRDMGDRERFLSVAGQLACRLRDVCCAGTAECAQLEPETSLMYATILAEIGDWEEAARVAELCRSASVTNHDVQDLLYHLELLARCCASAGDGERSRAFRRQAYHLCLALGWQDRAKELEETVSFGIPAARRPVC